MKNIVKFSGSVLMMIAVVMASAMSVSHIDVTKAKWVNPDVVRAAIPFTVGEDITHADITEAIKAIYKTGFYDDVSIDYQDGAVTVSVVAKPILGGISIEGDETILKAEQAAKLYEQAQLEVGKPLSMATVKQVENAMLQYYQFQGYYNVHVMPEIEQIDNGRVLLVMDVKLGDEAIIKTIKISGNQAYTDRVLFKQMQLKSSGLFSFFTNDDRYARTKLDMDLASLENWYYDAGYMDYKVVKDQVQLRKNNTQADIHLHIHEGPRYRVGEMEIQTGKSISDSALTEQLTLHTGDWYSRSALRNSVNQMNRYLSEQGYTGALVTVKTKHVNMKTHVVDMAIEVDPGKTYTVRDIEFSGNYVSDEKVLRHALVQYEGAVYSQEQIDISTRKLKNLGYIKNATCQPKPVGASQFVDVDCRVEEAMASTMTGKVGYSDTEKFLYGLNFSQNNFLGTGNAFSIDFNHSEAETSYNVSHAWPNLTVDGVSGNMNVFYRKTTPNRVNVSQYHTDNYGLSFGLGIPVAKDHRLSSSVGYEHIKIKAFDDSPTEITDYIATYGDIFKQLKWSVSWGYNSLDRFIFPTTGQNHDVVADIAIPYNDEDKTLAYYKLIYKNTIYQPLFHVGTFGDVIFLSKTSVGYGDGLGNQDGNLPWFRNFFAGGLGSVRGYKVNSLGPKGTQSSGATGSALGGNILLTQSVNVIIPQSINEDMRFAVFFDMGNVYADHVSLSDLRYAAGVSLQWRTAIAPLVFNFGFPIHLRSEDVEDRFSFSVSAGA